MQAEAGSIASGEWTKVNARPARDMLLSRFSLVGDRPIFDKSSFPWVPNIELAWPDIREEADVLAAHADRLPPLSDILPDHCEVEARRERVFLLHGYDGWVKENCRRCPEAVRAITRVPNLVDAFFSLLLPKSHIRQGSSQGRGVLTCQLAIQMPSGPERCRMNVNGHPIVWPERECVIFDDSYPHEIWNDSNGIRIVLQFRFKRPASLPGNLMTDLLLWRMRRSPAARAARCNLSWWEDVYASV